MNRSIITLLACITIFSALPAQDDWNLNVHYVAWVADPSGKAFKNTPVNATLGYKDSEGTLLYSESHTGVTNTLGNVGFLLGSGTPIEGTLSLNSFRKIASFNYDITVDNKGEEFHVVGEKPVGSAPRANASGWALCAKSAKSLGDVCWHDDVIPINELLNPIEPVTYQFTSVRDEGTRESARKFVTTSLTDLARMRLAPEVTAAGNEISYLNIGTGLGRPMYCGPEPSFISAMHAIRMPTIGNLTFGAELILQNYNADHPTYTFYAQNLNTTGGAIFASSPNLAVSALGTNAIQAGTYGLANGYGLYGVVLNAPNTGGNKSGIVASSGNFSDSYAASLYGLSFSTDALMVLSDERLKRNIRSGSNALSQIHMLRPSTYEYIDGTPYHFPEGTQHGFIAQELETTFPELVKDISLPSSLDPDEMSTSKTVQYKAINYEGLIPILTSAIQELDAKVISQESEIGTLKEIVENLSMRLAAIEK